MSQIVSADQTQLADGMIWWKPQPLIPLGIEAFRYTQQDQTRNESPYAGHYD